MRHALAVILDSDAIIDGPARRLLAASGGLVFVALSGGRLVVAGGAASLLLRLALLWRRSAGDASETKDNTPRCGSARLCCCCQAALLRRSLAFLRGDEARERQRAASVAQSAATARTKASACAAVSSYSASSMRPRGANPTMLANVAAEISSLRGARACQRRKVLGSPRLSARAAHGACGRAHGHANLRQHADSLRRVQRVLDKLTDRGVQTLAVLCSRHGGSARQAASEAHQRRRRSGAQAHVVKACDVAVFGKELCWRLGLQLRVHLSRRGASARAPLPRAAPLLRVVADEGGLLGPEGQGMAAACGLRGAPSDVPMYHTSPRPTPVAGRARGAGKRGRNVVAGACACVCARLCRIAALPAVLAVSLG